MYILHTEIAAAAIRGDAAVDDQLLNLDPEDWAISSLTHSELVFGLARRPEATKLTQLVENFLAVTFTLPWGLPAAQAHGRLRAALRAARAPIGDFDEMIAAHCLSLDATLVTRNFEQFERIPGLKWVTW